MTMARIMGLGIVLVMLGCKEPSGVPADDGTGLSDTFEQRTLIIENDVGKRLDFNMYVALGNEQHRQGLMYVRQMPEMTGMLFVYGQPGVRSIWMKNTYIPLDIIFIRADNTVSSIHRNATPLTLNSRSSAEAVKYIIELNAGVTDKYNIGTNSRIVWEQENADEE